MKSFFIALALLCDTGTASPAVPDDTLRSVAQSVQTGSILASQGDCLAVRVYTLSRFTHVGTVVMRDGQPFVYDSMTGTGVRCLPLTQYLAAQSPADVQLFHPTKSFTARQQKQFEEQLVRQLGRPYSVKHFVTGTRCQGLHCAEYITESLIVTGHVEAQNPARVSPAELLNCLTENNIYTAGETYDVPSPPSVPVEPSKSWCGYVWQGTKSCSYGCWRQMTRWVCCK